MNERILLVEDDATTRRLLASGLASAGYAVREAADGETALALLGADAFDIVISDIRMRRVDGVQVLRAARERPTPPAVLLLTGYSSVESAVAALRLGAYDYLQKPCELDDLLERVAAALQRRAEEHRMATIRRLAQEIAGLDPRGDPPDSPLPHEAGQLLVGELTIDRARYEVSFQGHQLRLTPIEFALICCLAESEGRVVGYQALARRTHELIVTEDEAQALLRSHVHNLRHKIDPAYIVAVRGAGYMLRAP